MTDCAIISTQVSDQSEKRVYTVNEIQDILGIGRTTAYALVKRGLFHSIRVGQKVLISRKSFDEWLDKS